VDEAQMNDSISGPCTALQALDIFQVSPMRCCTSFGDYLGGCITTSETKHLMTIVKKFLYDGATNEASGTCHEDAHFD
jgi:hypothetical protein